MGIFRAYDVRGIYGKDITEETALKIGNHFATICPTKKILIGYDTRLSSKKLLQSLVKGLRMRGTDVFVMGVCSTPEFYFACHYFNFHGGIMITASHNPKEYNGFKFAGPEGIPIHYNSGLSKLEKEIRKNLKVGVKGRLRKLKTKKYYNEFLTHFIKGITKHTVVLDTSNGSGYKDADVLKKVAKLTHINKKRDGNFPNHDPNPIVWKNLKQVIAEVKEKEADIGVCFDGDADRVVFIDEDGKPIPSDYILALLESELKKGQKAVADLRLSKILDEVAKKRGTKIIRSKVGRTNIIDHMLKENAHIGGEVSGHFYFKNNNHLDSAVITLITVLNIMSKKRRTLSQLIKPYKKYALSEEINFKAKKTSLNKIKKLSGKKSYMDGVSVKTKDYWFNVRASNTEPFLRFKAEAKDKKTLEKVVQKIKKLLDN